MGRSRGFLRATFACAVLALAPAASWGSEAEPDETFVSVDPYVSIESGSDLTRTGVSLLGALEGAALRPLAPHPAAGIATRTILTLAFDLPVAWWFGVLEHEAFGHGGRAREFGASTGVHMGSPWGGRDSYATYSIEGLDTNDLLRIAAGGTESNTWTATQMERDLVGGRAMRPFDLLFLAANRWVDFAYVVRTTPDPSEDSAGFWAEWSGGGDVAGYLGRLSERYTGQPGITPSGSSDLVRTEYGRLRRQAFWSLADPGFWLAFWTAGRAVVTGEETPRVPLPSARGRKILPVLSADWLPDGGVASLEILVGPRESADPERVARWSSFVIRRGSGPGGSLVALGAATERIATLGERVALGGETELWSQPGHGVGGGIRARLSPTRGRLRGFFAEIGVKSAGHWPGRPAEAGPFVRIGLAAPL